MWVEAACVCPCAQAQAARGIHILARGTQPCLELASCAWRTAVHASARKKQRHGVPHISQHHVCRGLPPRIASAHPLGCTARRAQAIVARWKERDECTIGDEAACTTSVCGCAQEKAVGATSPTCGALTPWHCQQPS